MLRRKLGAYEDRQRHHVLYYWMPNDESELVAARFSHSSRGQIPNRILNDTARRLKLSRAELNALVECTLSGDRFRELWEER